MIVKKHREMLPEFRYIVHLDYCFSLILV